MCLSFLSEGVNGVFKRDLWSFNSTQNRETTVNNGLLRGLPNLSLWETEKY